MPTWGQHPPHLNQQGRLLRPLLPLPRQPAQEMAVTEAAFHLEPMAIPSLAPAEQALGHQLGLEHPMPMALAAMAAMAPEVAPAMPTGPALAMAAMAAMPMAMVPMLAVFRLVASEDVVSLLVALGDVGSPPVALEAHKLRHPPLGDQAKAYTAFLRRSSCSSLQRLCGWRPVTLPIWSYINIL